MSRPLASRVHRIAQQRVITALENSHNNPTLALANVCHDTAMLEHYLDMVPRPDELIYHLGNIPAEGKTEVLKHCEQFLWELRDLLANHQADKTGK